MKHKPPHESYIVEKLAPSFRVVSMRDKSYDIEAERDRRCLSPVGKSFFMYALLGYLGGARQEADALTSKAGEFLTLARSIGEKQKYSYAAGFSEGVRSTALSYIRWLETGAVDLALIEDAKSQFDLYFATASNIDRQDADIMAPTLLYLSAYDLIDKLSRALGIGAYSTRQTRLSGPFSYASRIASAADGPARQAEEEKLRKRLGKQLFNWIEHGQYDSVAYLLHALFPRPDGPPSSLIEQCWRWIPEEVIEQRPQQWNPFAEPMGPQGA